VRTPAPDFDAFSGYIDQTIADYDWYRTVAALNAPFSETFAIRIAGVYDDRGSFSKNVGSSPSKPGSGTDTGARISMRYQTTEGAMYNQRNEYFNRDTGNNAIKNRTTLHTSGPFVIDEDAISFLDQRGYRASLEGRFDLPSDLQLRVLASYFDAETTD